ncbi:MAG: DUF192 domain-containing protein [Vulcanimicrobiaceae bacterium]
MTSSLLRLSVLGVLLLGSGASRAATAPPAPATTACANQRLPAEILAGTAQRSAGTPLPIVDVRNDQVTLRMAVAADETTRELGLMCVTHMQPAAGMLFVFEDDDQQDFWMKRTLIPLDLIWVASDGTVRSIASDVPASTLQTPDERVARRAGRGRFVLELSAGQAAVFGIVKGSRLFIPPVKAL